MCSFKKGDILLESKPFATILTKENVDKRCEVCFCEFEFLGKEKREQNGLLKRQCSQEIIQCSDSSINPFLLPTTILFQFILLKPLKSTH